MGDYENRFFKNKMVINYLIFGVITTLVNWLVYSLLVSVVGIGINFANIVAWIIAVILAFFTNKKWVFESGSWKISTLMNESISFIGSRLVSGIFEIVSLPILVGLGVNQQLFGVDGFVAKALVSVIVVIANYVFSKWFVFKKVV